MTLKSMTGFARADGTHGNTAWSWEARSVNGRNLDLRLCLPSGFDGIELRARGLCQERLARGNCTINLSLKRESGEMEIRLNEAALRQAVALGERAQDLTNMAAPQLDTLLAMRGVVEVAEGEENEEARAALADALIAGLATALDNLVAALTATPTLQPDDFVPDEILDSMVQTVQQATAPTLPGWVFLE